VWGLAGELMRGWSSSVVGFADCESRRTPNSDVRAPWRCRRDTHTSQRAQTRDSSY
jgi:hypothetical protein